MRAVRRAQVTLIALGTLERWDVGASGALGPRATVSNRSLEGNHHVCHELFPRLPVSGPPSNDRFESVAVVA